MKRDAMTIDLRACVGRSACSVARTMENVVPIGVHGLWIRNSESGTFPNPTAGVWREQCDPCEDASPSPASRPPPDRAADPIAPT